MYHHFFKIWVSQQVNIAKQVQFFQFSLRFPFSFSIITLIQEWKYLQNFWSVLQLIFLFRSSPDWHPADTTAPRETCPNPAQTQAKATQIPHCLLAPSKHPCSLFHPKAFWKRREENSEDCFSRLKMFKSRCSLLVLHYHLHLCL